MNIFSAMSWTRPSYFRYGKLTGTSPWDVFSRLTALKLPAAGYGASIVLFVLILIGMAAQPRFFCQFLCPMGAVFALLPVLVKAALFFALGVCLGLCRFISVR